MKRKWRYIGGLLAFIGLASALTWMWIASGAAQFWWAAWSQRPVSPQLANGMPPPLAEAYEVDLSDLRVPEEEIRSGGPPKDGIPAITDPYFTSGKSATHLRPTDRVIGLSMGSVARAYPLKIMDYHEIVNDTVNGEPIAVTYCPLCDSAAVFDRKTPLGVREFGVSGLLYNSNVLMYDRGGGKDSLWSQLMNSGISGSAAGMKLKVLPVELTTWQDWLERHPDTEVLTPESPQQARRYEQNPYTGYFDVPRLMFPVDPIDHRLPTKARVLGVWTDNAARAYPLSRLEAHAAEQQERGKAVPNEVTIESELEGKKLTLKYNPQAKSVRVVESDEGVRWIYSLWFAWYAFHPETEIYDR